MQESTTTRQDGANASADGTKTPFEQLREDIKKLGEDCETGFRQLSKQIADLDARWTEKWTRHDLALRDHRKRITDLEQ